MGIYLIVGAEADERITDTSLKSFNMLSDQSMFTTIGDLC